MEYQLIHYSKCSTSVKGLALLQANGINPQIIDYFKNPLSEAQITQIAQKLGGARAMIRQKTAQEFGIDLNQDDIGLVKAMASNPKLIQRPISLKGEKAVLGRPIESMLGL